MQIALSQSSHRTAGVGQTECMIVALDAAGDVWLYDALHRPMGQSAWVRLSDRRRIGEDGEVRP